MSFFKKIILPVVEAIQGLFRVVVGATGGAMIGTLGGGLYGTVCGLVGLLAGTLAGSPHMATVWSWSGRFALAGAIAGALTGGFYSLIDGKVVDTARPPLPDERPEGPGTAWGPLPPVSEMPSPTP